MIDPTIIEEMDHWEAKFRKHRSIRHPDFQPVVDSWVRVYLEASSEDREAMRSAVAARSRLADGVDFAVSGGGKRLTGPEDCEYLRLSVGASSLANCPLDYRDTWSNLAKLVVRAERSGMDPIPTLKEIALLSSDAAPSGGFKSMREVLENIDSYAVVKELRGNQNTES